MRKSSILYILLLVLCVAPFSQLVTAQVPNSEMLELVVQTGHTNSVVAVAVSPDGNLIATAYSSGVGIVKLWDAATAREVRTIEADPLSIGDVRFSPNGQLLASGGSDGKIRLWDVNTAREVRVLSGHTDVVASVDFSPDGRWIASASRSKDPTVKIWDAATGDLVRTFAGHTASVRRVAFSPDGRLLASASEDRTVKLWEVGTGGKRHTLVGHDAAVLDVAFSPDGRWIASAGGGGDKTIKIWSADTGRQLRTLRGHKRSVYAVAFSPDGRWLASGGDHIKLWDPVTGREHLTLKSPDRTGLALALAFNPNGDLLVSGYLASVVKVWDLSEAREQSTLGQLAQSVTVAGVSPNGLRLALGGETTISFWNLAVGRQAQVLRGHTNLVKSIAFSLDGALFASAGDDRKVILWNSATGQKQRTLDGFDDAISEIAFSPNKVWIATGAGASVVSARGDNTIKIWEISTGRNVRTLTGHNHYVRAIAFNSDGSLLVSGSDDRTLKLWDPSTGQLLRTLTGHTGRVFNVAVSPDERRIASGSEDGTVRLWETATGKELHVLISDSRRRRRGAPPVAFSPDSRLLATGTDSHDVTLWDVTSGQPGQVLRGHKGHVFTLVFTPDGRRVISGSADGTSRIWDVSAGTELIRLISFQDGTWAVVDSEGRFDAADGGDVEGLHWVLRNEPIALSQLKERYYDPGLLAKMLEFNEEPLRNIETFRNVALYPAIELNQPTAGNPTLAVNLTNRGGGIGEVIISINGKEVEADARGPKPNPNEQELQLQVPLSRHPYLIPGKENEIEVRAFNAEGYLSSRGVTVVYQPPGEVSIEKPTLWAIISGVSNYTGEDIDLRYAAKDAEAIATALTLGAKRLFGAEKAQVALLTKDQKFAPTKANIEQAFEKVRAAKPWDILVVYLAGHGVALGDTYYFLTQEARSTNLIDPAIRAQAAISSEELVAWIKKSPALKQVMVLDTCAAGTAARKLVESRNISSDQIRAIERLKDRTGFHVLMGSAADAVSYEATQYEQGLLTYALLQGMRGAALREEEYVDVSRLFQHAADAVPDLATHIGGIQRPVIAAPKGTSFVIGQLKAEDRQLIPLPRSKPMLLPPVLLNPQEGFDDLELSVKLRRGLREKAYASLRGTSIRLPAVYVDADQLAGAIRPSGTYRVVEGHLKADLVLVKDGRKLIDLRVEGEVDDLKTFASRAVEEIIQAVQSFK